VCAVRRPVGKDEPDMNKRDTAKYRKLLTNARSDLAGQVRRLKEDLNKSRKDSSGDLSGYSYHMADAATDTFNEQVESDIVSSETETLREIEEALERLDEGTYGICEMCGEPIAPKRLTAIPYARLCIKCKAESERSW